MDRQLGNLMQQLENAIQQRQREQQGEEAEEIDQEFTTDTSDEDTLSAADEHHIEQLFEQARRDRSKAYELKRELDRQEVFGEYEDRFLDLFRNRAVSTFSFGA